MRYAAVAIGLAVILLVVFWATRKPLSIADELGKLTPGDRQALDGLLADSGLTAMQLSPQSFASGIEYQPRSLAVEQGRVTGLRLDDVPLKHLDSLPALTGLRWLRLHGNQLATLPNLAALGELRSLDVSNNKLRDLSPLAGLRQLRQLRLADNDLDSVQALSTLSALEKLDVSNNRLTDLKPLAALGELREVGAAKNPLQSLPEPIPARWTMNRDPVPPGPPPPRPPNWVAQKPATSGWARTGTSRHGSGLQGDRFESTIQSLKSAQEVPIVWTAAPLVSMQVTVAKGRVRIYLAYRAQGRPADGYVFADAEPGKPGQLHGELIGIKPNASDNTDSGFLVEPLDGEAEGIGFQVVR